MDYTNKEVRASLYRERKDILEFGIDKTWTVAWSMHAPFISLRITDLENQDECILACYNNAYYIATVILQEKTPEHYVAQFWKIAMSVPTDNELYRVQHAVLTMAMVVNIVQLCNEKYQVSYCALRQLIDDCVKRECNKVGPSIETYIDYKERIDDIDEIKKPDGTYRHTVNRNDFIPLNQQEVDTSSNSEAPATPLERIKELEEELEAQRKWKQLTKEQVALFCHALAEYCNFAQKTKQNDIAPMASKLFGVGEKSAYNNMCGYTKDDREHVAGIFENIWPDFSYFVLNTLEKRKVEKQ